MNDALRCICTEAGEVATESDCDVGDGGCKFDVGKNACMPTTGRGETKVGEGEEADADAVRVLKEVREIEAEIEAATRPSQNPGAVVNAPGDTAGEQAGVSSCAIIELRDRERASKLL